MKKYLRSTVCKNELFSKVLENRFRKVKAKQFVALSQAQGEYFIAG